MATAQTIDPSLTRTMKGSLRLYDNADIKWFDSLSDDATVYAIGTAEPIVGRKAYERNFGKLLTANKRKTKVVHQDVRMMGDTAVVTQTLQIKQLDTLSNVRQSVVWSKLGRSWRIRHLHSALIGQPQSTMTLKTASDIQVLNEKIATVAAVLGVAQ